mmetsp:Transcript_59235/g.152430  ORF Transcript_59235/g.152430 Transcript_59235/m.152430 type:complete len:279 (+) Transcript_59235:873-1709(+)
MALRVELLTHFRLVAEPAPACLAQLLPRAVALAGSLRCALHGLLGLLLGSLHAALRAPQLVRHPRLEFGKALVGLVRLGTALLGCPDRGHLLRPQLGRRCLLSHKERRKPRDLRGGDAILRRHAAHLLSHVLELRLQLLDLSITSLVQGGQCTHLGQQLAVLLLHARRRERRVRGLRFERRLGGLRGCMVDAHLVQLLRQLLELRLHGMLRFREPVAVRLQRLLRQEKLLALGVQLITQPLQLLLQVSVRLRRLLLADCSRSLHGALRLLLRKALLEG